jgi:hypothetical protein
MKHSPVFIRADRLEKMAKIAREKELETALRGRGPTPLPSSTVAASSPIAAAASTRCGLGGRPDRVRSATPNRQSGSVDGRRGSWGQASWRRRQGRIWDAMLIWPPCCSASMARHHRPRPNGLWQDCCLRAPHDVLAS